VTDWDAILAVFALAIVAAFVAGLVCPLVGCLLFVRRTSFHGIVLPQFAAAGIACGFALLPRWGRLRGLGPSEVQQLVEDTHLAHNWHLAWAGLFTLSGLALLTVLGRRARGSETGRLAAAFAIASAVTVLAAHASPVGEMFVHGLLRGEILFVGRHELENLGVGLGLVLLAIFVFHRDLLITSFDRETAVVLGKPVVLFEALLAGITGLAVAVGVLSVGPMVLFGLLVLPPIAARRLSRSMQSFYVLASAFGVASVALGLWGSFHFDLPLGPCLVIAAGLLAAPGVVLARR